MARINIEDKLFPDRRWTKLMLTVGCHHKALGILTWAWILAQKNWLQYGSIPKKAWTKDLDVLIECELANRREDGTVYVKGSKAAFAWLEQRVEAGRKGGLGGRTGRGKNTTEEAIQKNGARVMLSKAVQSGAIIKPDHCTHCGKGGIIEGHHSDYSKPLEVDWVCKKCHNAIHTLLKTAGAKRPLDAAEQPKAEPKPPNLSLSQAPSLSQAQFPDLVQNTTAKPAKPKAEVSDAERELRRSTWQAYKEAYQVKWKVEPTPNATVNSQVAAFVRRIGQDSPDVLKFYVNHSDSFYVKKAHPVGLALKDAESLHTQWKKGMQITQAKMKQYEQSSHYREQMERAENGEM